MFPSISCSHLKKYNPFGLKTPSKVGKSLNQENQTKLVNREKTKYLHLGALPSFQNNKLEQALNKIQVFYSTCFNILDYYNFG